jgi:hypothetical protein
MIDSLQEGIIVLTDDKIESMNDLSSNIFNELTGRIDALKEDEK